MCHEHSGDPLFHEGVDRVEGLRRWARRELDELGGLVEADERIGHRMRRIADLRRRTVSDEFALWREHEVHEGSGDRPEHEQERALEPTADPTELEQCGREY